MDGQLRLIEECNGVGELRTAQQSYGDVAYEINRYQGMAASGMPIPGLLRIEGRLDLGAVDGAEQLVGSSLKLTLTDGRTLGLTLVDTDGRVLTEGHGPQGCSCC